MATAAEREAARARAASARQANLSPTDPGRPGAEPAQKVRKPKKKKGTEKRPFRKAELRQARTQTGAASGNQNPGRIAKAIDKVVKAGKPIASAAGAAVGATQKAAQATAAKLSDTFRSDPTTTRSQARADAKAAKAAKASGLDVTSEVETRPGERALGKKAPSKGLKLAKAIGGRAVAGAGLGVDVATTPTNEIINRLSSQFPGTAPSNAILNFAARKFRGEDTGAALGSTFRDIASPASLGFLDPSGNNPLVPNQQAPRQSLFQRAKGLVGAGPTQADLDTFAAEDAAATAAQATGAGLPTPAQQATLRDAGVELEPGRGVGPGGAPAAQFGPDQERVFTNPDAQAAAAGIDPASRRGTASVEENQAVISRLIERNRGIRAQGIQAAAQQGQQGQPLRPGQQQADNQIPVTGIASAFGSLALSGNQLRREAADRTRAAAGQISERELQNKRDVAVIGQAGDLARASATRDQNFSDNLNRLATTFGDITRDGTRDERNAFLDSTFLVASNNPGGPEAAFAMPMLGAEIRDLAGKGFLTSFDPRTERGIFDWLASFGQGGQAEPLLTPAGQVTINVQTGMIEIVSEDKGTRQPLIDISKLPARHQELLRSQAVFVNKQVLADQPGDPNLRGRGAVTLRDAAQ